MKCDGGVSGRNPGVDLSGLARLLRRRFARAGLAAGALLLSAGPPVSAADRLELWYDRPAANWNEALPIGNGRMGAMIFGGIAQERLQFNEGTLWTGRPREYQHEGAVKFLPVLRDLCNESRVLWLEARDLERQGQRAEAEAKRKASRARQEEAETIGLREFMSIPLRQMAYQPFGDVHLQFPDPGRVSAYRRSLDLDTACVRVSYRGGDTTFTRECFASHPDGVIVWRVTADRPGQVNLVARMDSPHPSARTVGHPGDQLALFGEVEEGGLRFEARMRIRAQGGSVMVSDDSISVEAADSVTLLLAGATSHVSFRDIGADPGARADALVKRATRRSYGRLLQAHRTDHQRLFRRVSLDLGWSEAAAMPTDQRLAGYASGHDPDLAALVFQYGRYLLIGSSRAGGQPANLQGIWNDLLRPPWDSKWTVNINTEMNYWPAEVANLSECAAPLFDLIGDCAVTGRETARAHYGMRGWVLHHNTDLWRGTAPINHSNHGIWPTGGAWLCQHLWEHWLFTGDREFLAQRAYPLMKAASWFFLDYLFRDPLTGYDISGPSNSPEQGGLVNGPAMDHQIIRALFGNTAEAARILKRDADLAVELDARRRKIAPDQIGQHGQLQEWLEDRDDPGNQHRHLSHLWAVYPGGGITPEQAELFGAARQSLIYRGDEATGWSMGWKLNLWARFLDGERAYRILGNLLRPAVRSDGRAGGGLYPNLFDAHPPFQIDGNFGACAGIAEMLLQSHTGEIALLPALPKAWPAGRVTGLRARGGYTVDISWREGQVTDYRIAGRRGGTVTVRLHGRTEQAAVSRR